MNLWYSLHLLCVKFVNQISDVHQPKTNRSNNFGRDSHPLLLLVFDKFNVINLYVNSFLIVY